MNLVKLTIFGSSLPTKKDNLYSSLISYSGFYEFRKCHAYPLMKKNISYFHFGYPLSCTQHPRSTGWGWERKRIMGILLASRARIRDKKREKGKERKQKWEEKSFWKIISSSIFINIRNEELMSGGDAGI